MCIRQYKANAVLFHLNDAMGRHAVTMNTFMWSSAADSYLFIYWACILDLSIGGLLFHFSHNSQAAQIYYPPYRYATTVRKIWPWFLLENFLNDLLKAWNEILGELEKTTQAIQKGGSDVSFTRSEITSFSSLLVIYPCTHSTFPK